MWDFWISNLLSSSNFLVIPSILPPFLTILENTVNYNLHMDLTLSNLSLIYCFLKMVKIFCNFLQILIPSFVDNNFPLFLNPVSLSPLLLLLELVQDLIICIHSWISLKFLWTHLNGQSQGKMLFNIIYIIINIIIIFIIIFNIKKLDRKIPFFWWTYSSNMK